MNLGLIGKKALVSGGTHGIGKSIALSLAREGCSVAVFSRTVERVVSMARELENISNGNDYISECADALDYSSIDKVTNIIEQKWGGVDILINNVGGGGRWGNDIVEQTDFNVWSDVYKKNTGVAIKLTMWAIPYMRKYHWGRVVSIASIYGKESGGRPWFDMAKSSQISLMKSLSKYKYLARYGITFNSISPGPIKIEDTGWCDNKDELKDMENDIPMGRLGTPEEVAFVVKCICSPYNSFMNGSCISIDGGLSNSF